MRPTKVWDAATKRWATTGLPEATRPMVRAEPDGPGWHCDMVMMRTVEPWFAAELVAHGYVVVDGVLRPPEKAKA